MESSAIFLIIIFFSEQHAPAKRTLSRPNRLTQNIAQ